MEVGTDILYVSNMWQIRGDMKFRAGMMTETPTQPYAITILINILSTKKIISWPRTYYFWNTCFMVKICFQLG